MFQLGLEIFFFAGVKQSFLALKALLGRASVLQIFLSKTSHQGKESVLAEGKNSPTFFPGEFQN